jgi:hypothetical protein
MDYDAIKGREGCEPESGNEWYGLKPFSQLCVSLHDPASEIFGMPLNVSYSVGPGTKGDPTHPFTTPWAAWVGSTGVRVGQSTHIDPPADDVGDHSTLYLNEKPPELTHAWNERGDLAIAIQKDKDHIELKQYTDDLGNIATYSWKGRSPALFYSGRVLNGDPSQGQLVCYYLSTAADFPELLYARFESEGWATERIVMPSMRTALKRLIHVDTIQSDFMLLQPTQHVLSEAVMADFGVVLYAIDEDDRDVTLTTLQHILTFDERANLNINLEGGGLFENSAANVDAGLDKGRIDIRPSGGQLFKPLIDPTTPLVVDSASLSVDLVGGEILS